MHDPMQLDYRYKNVKLPGILPPIHFLKTFFSFKPTSVLKLFPNKCGPDSSPQTGAAVSCD